MTLRSLARTTIGAIAILAFTGSANAAIQCGDHKKIIEVLASKYSEAPKAIGIVNQKQFMEVYVSRAGGWTILVTSANGNSCIVAAGQNWEDVPHNLSSLDPAA